MQNSIVWNNPNPIAIDPTANKTPAPQNNPAAIRSIPPIAIDSIPNIIKFGRSNWTIGKKAFAFVPIATRAVANASNESTITNDAAVIVPDAARSKALPTSNPAEPTTSNVAIMASHPIPPAKVGRSVRTRSLISWIMSRNVIIAVLISSPARFIMNAKTVRFAAAINASTVITTNAATPAAIIHAIIVNVSAINLNC